MKLIRKTINIPHDHLTRLTSTFSIKEQPLQIDRYRIQNFDKISQSEFSITDTLRNFVAKSLIYKNETTVKTNHKANNNFIIRKKHTFC